MHQSPWSGWPQARRRPKGKSQSPTQLLGHGNLWLAAERAARKLGGQGVCNPGSQVAERSRLDEWPVDGGI